MDLLAGQALRQFRKEITRALQDRGFFQPARPRVSPSQRQVSEGKDNVFFKEELAGQQRRQRKTARQQFAWVVVGMLLPLLVVVLKVLFF